MRKKSLKKREPNISIVKVVNDPYYLNALKNPLKYSDIQSKGEITSCQNIFKIKNKSIFELFLKQKNVVGKLKLLKYLLISF